MQYTKHLISKRLYQLILIDLFNKKNLLIYINRRIQCFDSVKKIIAEELNIDESSITLETRLVEDLKADSIDSIQLIMALEEEFNISISDDSVQDIKTVGDIVNIIKKK